MTSHATNVSERLAHAFANWQLYYLGHELEVTRRFAEGKATNQDRIDSQRGCQLAGVILNNNIETLTPDQWVPRKELVGKDDLCGKQLRYYYESFPSELFTWNRKSRRAFHLPISLEAMLASATFPEMKWDDVLWPHESFVISLEKPLQVRHPRGVSQSFDTILVSRMKDEDGGYSVYLRWFQVPPKAGVRQGFSIGELKRFREFVKKNNLLRALNLWSRVGKSMQRFTAYVPGSQFANFRIGESGFSEVVTEPGELYERLGDATVPWEHVAESDSTWFECLSVTLRLVVGWMCYLETLSNDSLEWSKKDTKKPLRSIAGGAPGIITEPDQICTIVGRGKIDPAEVTSESKCRNSRGFVRPHWRRAHYKRPRGSLPGTAKTVRIPPVLVRADLVPLYGIIAGTNTIVLSEE